MPVGSDIADRIRRITGEDITSQETGTTSTGSATKRTRSGAGKGKQQQKTRLTTSAQERVPTKQGRIPERVDENVRGGNNDEVWKCEECKVAYENDDDELLSCSYCDKHWCTKCIEMTSEEYATAQRPDLFWFCPTCATKVKIFLGTGMIEQRMQIESLQEDVQKKLNTFEKYLDKKLDTFEKKFCL